MSPFIVALIPLLPALAVLVNGLLGFRVLKEKAHRLGVGSVALSFLLSLWVIWQVAFAGARADLVFYEWVVAGNFSVSIGFLIDPLTAVMLFVVTGVGLLVHIYSIGYMHGDPGYPRFFTYMNLFMVSMLLLVMANNYLLLFVGWEGVGLCSYLLIGYWYEKKSASDAGKKAFIVNRIGDAGFLLGVFLVFMTFGSLDFREVFPRADQAAVGVLTAITLLLFVGAVGKSAQLPLHVWLPDAMEGPTPVSALIHAATMVTAGVYMVARSHVLFSLAPVSLQVVAAVGALTAIFSASIGLVQNDIKRVMAYSTVSQLGYMFFGLGVGAYAAGIFHLMTHAFFKGLLFLGAGSVIHALAGEQDMRRMGGLRSHLPVTAPTLYVASLALAGIPPFAGFWSKDEILGAAFKEGQYLLWALGVVAAFMTAFYVFRMIYMTFYGESRVERERAHHIHESPRVMTWPLILLAALSTVGGIIPGFPPEGGLIHGFLGQVFASHGAPEAQHGLELVDYGLMGVSVAVGLAGWGLARFFYISRPEIPGALARRFSFVYRLLLNKYWVDEIYAALVVNPLLRLGRSLRNFDERVIDGAVNGVSFLTVLWGRISDLFDRFTVDGAVNGAGAVVRGGARNFRRLQTGFAQNYALAMLLGIFVIASLYLLF
ncbi:MAG: NADH-quinone oxidoreductase subunit L [Candidatus Tectomicrobia bacterium]|uniref:NADH-quinone oxidoreductase subunit L n=1 Tax=Tectimicrobiota bacterium TaxID=2528274 RepID=A0A932LZE2_UNCTE|nr:NADH-quinone oxidoreductase subunit L [Candidatus Tectomicrobia bacterium]